MNTKLNSKITDCDVHHSYKYHSELYPFLEPVWKERLEKYGFGYPQDTFVSSVGAKRRDAYPREGTVGSDVAFLQEQLLEGYGMDYVLLNGGGIIGVSLMPDTAFPTALAQAYNDWLTENWLSKDERFLGAMHVALQDPEKAAVEIRRKGSHPSIVQVFLPAVTSLPIGHKFYRPVLEAIAEMDLVLAFHPKQPAVSAPHVTPVDMPGSYLEWHTLASMPYMAQLTNLVFSGVFEELPKLRVLFLEGGISWLPALLWRMDKNYKGLRKEAPWLKKLPSEYVLSNCRFSTQPIEEPDKRGYLETIYEMINGKDTIVFATDYPHWDFDDPYFAMKDIPQEWRPNILYNNAAKMYNLEK